MFCKIETNMHVRVIIVQYGLTVGRFGTAETKQKMKITNSLRAQSAQTKQDVLVNKRHWPSLRLLRREDRIRQISTYSTNLGLEISPGHLRR